MLKRPAVALSVAFFTCFGCLAQTRVARPAFDAASIRPASDSARSDIQTAPGTLTVRNQSLQFMLHWAYDTPPFQVIGPAWLNDARFDVLAKSESGGDDAQLRLMLQGLLATRFGVVTHPEQKETQVYTLTLAKGGPKFQESKDEGPPEFTNGPGLLIAHRVTMADLAAKISEPLNRPVIDETNLTGKYEIRIDVAAYMQSQSGGDAKGGGIQIDVMSVLFNALQAQLGVKLESKKATVNMLVLDHAEKVPTEN